MAAIPLPLYIVILLNSRFPENVLCSYGVIETRLFQAFQQSSLIHACFQKAIFELSS